MKLAILYEDNEYVFINKPSGILSIPDRHNAEIPNITGALRKIYGNIFIVHRLDRETSGCICFAKDEATHRYTSKLFETRDVEKFYRGIIHGTPPMPYGRIEEAIMEHPTIKGKMIINAKQGKPSITEYETLESFGMFSYLSFKLLTGRTHQIRIHCSNMGNPLVCDGLYGKDNPVFISSLKKRYHLSKNEEEEMPILSRIGLHAYQLTFKHPNGKLLSIEAPLPKDMSAMLNQCRKWLK